MQRQCSHFGPSNHPTRRVGPFVQLGLDAEASRGPSVTDQLHDGLEGAERTAEPVLGDVTEEAVLNLVPLAGAGRRVGDVDAQTQVIGQPLQFCLPCALAIAVAAARIGRDQEGVGLWVGPPPHHRPPLANRSDRERRRAEYVW
jgi:hypothetical protein